MPVKLVAFHVGLVLTIRPGSGRVDKKEVCAKSRASGNINATIKMLATNLYKPCLKLFKVIPLAKLTNLHLNSNNNIYNAVCQVTSNYLQS